jgi:hypothetical protein
MAAAPLSGAYREPGFVAKRKSNQSTTWHDTFAKVLTHTKQNQ